ncbi:helix-turn-helix domain-containing protein [Tersicoccus sp. Bi-70]|uniref:winged helix-turn-helix domain-containing protein n=1 Tax=Tersicoccus sp. Bi-70 TaxID=1897634 RepID=UPI0018E9613A|nr:helix-turn-helix domain-containing protein [Tersicoccus sp. Bi-70]
MDAYEPTRTAPALVPTVMTSPMLKAMAHPVRRRIVSVLGAVDHARAADLARQLDIPANAVSFHLRTLADAGFVEEAPEFARDRRDRVWKAVNQSWQAGSPQRPLRPEEEGTLAAYLHQVTLDQQDMMARLAAWAQERAAGRDREPRGEISIGSLRLTTQEARQVFDDVEAVLDRARSLHHESTDADEAAGVRVWDYTFMAARDDT